jgi:hypothetical protein
VSLMYLLRISYVCFCSLCTTMPLNMLVCNYLLHFYMKT